MAEGEESSCFGGGTSRGTRRPCTFLAAQGRDRLPARESRRRRRAVRFARHADITAEMVTTVINKSYQTRCIRVYWHRRQSTLPGKRTPPPTPTAAPSDSAAASVLYDVIIISLIRVLRRGLDTTNRFVSGVTESRASVVTLCVRAGPRSSSCFFVRTTSFRSVSRKPFHDPRIYVFLRGDPLADVTL